MCGREVQHIVSASSWNYYWSSRSLFVLKKASRIINLDSFLSGPDLPSVVNRGNRRVVGSRVDVSFVFVDCSSLLRLFIPGLHQLQWLVTNGGDLQENRITNRRPNNDGYLHSDCDLFRAVCVLLTVRDVLPAKARPGSSDCKWVSWNGRRHRKME